MYKLPQIMRIHRARSAAGISLLGSSMAAADNLFSIAYSLANRHPVSTYGENVPQLATICLIILQILRYEFRVALAPLAACGCGMLAAAGAVCSVHRLLGARAGAALLGAMKASSMALSLTGSLPQVLQNWRARSAGELSLATSSLGLLGSWVRMYTVLKQLAGDKKMVAGQTVSVVSNTTLVLQILLYTRRGGRRRPRA
uniref:Solute carrier family 66 member 3 n=1 Tax=Alexandrium catenella TaxID=2925 RepID=A0A7S1RAF2_ALECA